jgi:hypothetical protein
MDDERVESSKALATDPGLERFHLHLPNGRGAQV